VERVTLDLDLIRARLKLDVAFVGHHLGLDSAESQSNGFDLSRDSVEPPNSCKISLGLLEAKRYREFSRVYTGRHKETAERADVSARSRIRAERITFNRNMVGAGAPLALVEHAVRFRNIYFPLATSDSLPGRPRHGEQVEARAAGSASSSRSFPHPHRSCARVGPIVRA